MILHLEPKLDSDFFFSPCKGFNMKYVFCLIECSGHRLHFLRNSLS